MGMQGYVAPAYLNNAFHCPYCGAFARQTWADKVKGFRGNEGSPYLESDKLAVSACTNCGKQAIWLEKVMIAPNRGGAPPPCTDMPDPVRADYEEAAGVVQASPRAAAALLRLALQKLCVSLEQPGKKLDEDIASLVRQGLRVEIQQALDVVRVVGNNAVHPGEMDLKDDQQTCIALFGLLNMIVQDRITQPKEIQKLYAKLPQGAKDAIEKRDKGSDSK